jgi:hypothetical protein
MTSRTYPGLRARRCSASGRTAPAAVGKERFALARGAERDADQVEEDAEAAAVEASAGQQRGHRLPVSQM